MALYQTLFYLLPLFAMGANSAPSDGFGLYAYGPNFGGLSLVYVDGYAYVEDTRVSNSSNATVVTFSRGSSNTLMGSPSNTTSAGTPSWSNVLLTIPASSSTDRRVSFSTAGNASDDEVTKDFVFYGSTAMHKGSSGELEGLFTVLQGDSPLSAVYWNDTSMGQVAVVLRSMRPSNPPN